MALRRVLIVESDASEAAALARTLSDTDWTILWARDGHHALSLMHPVPPEVIFLALWLPSMDGLETLQMLRGMGVESPVVMLSGHGTIAAAVKAIQLGACTFLEKPVGRERLRQALQQAMPHSRSLLIPPDVLGHSVQDHPRLGGTPVSPKLPASLSGARPPAVARRGRTSRTFRSPPPTSKQKTLGRSVVLKGQGLQTGQKIGMILTPLPPQSGVVFCDLITRTTIPALVQYVNSTDLSTNLRRQGTVVRTVEHLLSVLHAYGLTNLRIKVCGEVPILDGSARDLCRVIEEAGVVEQEAAVEEFIVDRCYRIGDETLAGKSLLVEPYDGFKITYRLAYPPPLGVQLVSYEHRDGVGYRQAIAPARTFAFLQDVERLHDLGLMAGGRLNNVVLLDAGRVLNHTRLRFPDECARHKVLDIMGDFYLLGKPLRGHILANMTGHAENIALVAQLWEATRTHNPAAGRKEMPS
jgi:UDP-3-O-[3-hydroxymyristoyl] N-acetylglucosamine deacetylase